MITPVYLKKGDKIAIIATARKVTEEEIRPAIRKLEYWGLEVVLGENLFNEYNQFAGFDDERADDFQMMIDSSSIKAVICARGGYGTVRIIDKVNYENFIKNPKWIIGFSDSTVIHSHINTNFNIETLHAEMPINFPKDGNDNTSTESLRKCLFGEPIEYVFNRHKHQDTSIKTEEELRHKFHDTSIKTEELNSKNKDEKVNLYDFCCSRKGNAKGVLTGGNLSILYSLAGSISDIETDGKILFIEDIDEYLYHIDRMMLNLIRSGKLGNLAGLIVGGMTDMRDNQIPFGKNATRIIYDAVHEYNYPVCFGFPAGHLPENSALIMGRKAELNIDDNFISLKFDTRI